MKICLYGEFGYPSSKGTPLRLLAEARSLSKKGHDVTIMCVTGSDDDEFDFFEFNIDTGTLHPLSIIRTAPQIVPTVRSFLKRNDPDIIHAHTLESGVFPALATTFTDHNFIYEPHSNRIEELILENRVTRNSFATSYLYKVERGIVRAADGVITLTPKQLEELATRSSIANKPSQVIVGGCPSEFIETNEQYDFGDNPVMAYAGDFRDYQGIEGFVEIANSMLSTDKNIDPVIITYKEDTNKIDELLNEYGLQNKVEIYHVESEDLPRYLNGADILLAPMPDMKVNRYRYPSKLSLYLGSDAAVVATDVPSHRTVIEDGKTGYLYENAGQATQYISELIESPSQRESMITASREYARSHLSWDVLTEDILELYQEVEP